MQKNIVFSKVKVLIWDFDGTFYKPMRILWQAIRQAEYETIRRYTGWPLTRAKVEFDKLHKITLPSATATVASLCHIPTSVAAVEMEKYFDRRLFLKYDQLLVKLFGGLRKYRHYILANGSVRGITQSLIKLGLNPKIFTEIITSETTGVTKPDDAGFKYILSQTGLTPSRHLMIGDRPEVDLVPARKLGLKSALVWSQTVDKSADLTLPAVYDLAGYL
ncbi:hypothetical protein A2154_00790 [Candidatus Gottesmanbacteria bacterium RBG_16_43_7]|uniref:HAD family hydrolase n=1 Tax=Candidatus Gottesmanbacteria bacterium RBG_16_43_7 TaxID=1798373 RepID=A0A1F5Z887_9BACT|nr:MAG: hypothetical protein A2154_00790 [Candidatus Gottesmanbacteria bacterium RBG_16_43_7]